MCSEKMIRRLLLLVVICIITILTLTTSCRFRGVHARSRPFSSRTINVQTAATTPDDNMGDVICPTADGRTLSAIIVTRNDTKNTVNANLYVHKVRYADFSLTPSVPVSVLVLNFTLDKRSGVQCTTDFHGFAYITQGAAVCIIDLVNFRLVTGACFTPNGLGGGISDLQTDGENIFVLVAMSDKTRNLVKLEGAEKVVMAGGGGGDVSSSATANPPQQQSSSSSLVLLRELGRVTVPSRAARFAVDQYYAYLPVDGNIFQLITSSMEFNELWNFTLRSKRVLNKTAAALNETKNLHLVDESEPNSVTLIATNDHGRVAIVGRRRKPCKICTSGNQNNCGNGVMTFATWERDPKNPNAPMMRVLSSKCYFQPTIASARLACTGSGSASWCTWCERDAMRSRNALHTFWMDSLVSAGGAKMSQLAHVACSRGMNTGLCYYTYTMFRDWRGNEVVPAGRNRLSIMSTAIVSDTVVPTMSPSFTGESSSKSPNRTQTRNESLSVSVSPSPDDASTSVTASWSLSAEETRSRTHGTDSATPDESLSFSDSLVKTPSRSLSDGTRPSGSRSGDGGGAAPSPSFETPSALTGTETNAIFCDNATTIELSVSENQGSASRDGESRRSEEQELTARTAVARGQVVLDLRLRRRNPKDWYGPLISLERDDDDTKFALVPIVSQFWVPARFRKTGMKNVSKVERVSNRKIRVTVKVQLQNSLSDIDVAVEIGEAALACQYRLEQPNSTLAGLGGRIVSNELRFRRRYSFVSTNVVSTLNGGASVAAFLNPLIGGARAGGGGGAAGRLSAMNLQRARNALSALECEHNNHEVFEPLEFPAQTTIGDPEFGGWARGAAFFNLLTLLVIAVLLLVGIHVIFPAMFEDEKEQAKRLRKRRRSPWMALQAAFGFPGYMWNFIVPLQGSIIKAGVLLLRLQSEGENNNDDSSNKSVDTTLGASSIVCGFLPVLYVGYRIVPRSRLDRLARAVAAPIAPFFPRYIDSVSSRVLRWVKTFNAPKVEWVRGLRSSSSATSSSFLGEENSSDHHITTTTEHDDDDDDDHYFFAERYGTIFDAFFAQLYFYDLALQFLECIGPLLAATISSPGTWTCDLNRIFAPLAAATATALTLQLPFCRPSDNVIALVESALALAAVVFVLVSIQFASEKMFELSEAMELVLKAFSVVSFSWMAFWLVFEMEMVQGFLERNFFVGGAKRARRPAAARIQKKGNEKQQEEEEELSPSPAAAVEMMEGPLLS